MSVESLNKKISIIMPVYNAEKTIANSIWSIINQSRSDIEIIVVDGDSSDGTLDIIKSFGHSIDQWISEKDRGYADALNKGIKMATGEYVMMLAADDLMLPDAIKHFLETVDVNTEIWCGAMLEKTEYGFRLSNSDPDLAKLKYFCSLRHPATIFKKSIFEKYGFYDIKFKCAADRELFLRLYQKHASFQLEKIPMVLFSLNGMSCTNLELSEKEDCEITELYGYDSTLTKSIHKKATKREYFRWIKRPLAKIGLLPYIFPLFGYLDECLKKRDLEKWL